MDSATCAFCSTSRMVELSIAPQLDVAKNLFIGNLPMKGGLVDHKTLYRRTAEILSELDLNVSPKTIAGDLSVGQQQMLEIGRALTRNARVIIMDEPTSSLSESETETLFGVIKKLTAKNIAVVYISHKLDEVMFLSDRITVIRDGKNIVSRDKSEFTQEQLIASMIGRPLQHLYQKEAAEIGETMLEVKNLTRKGVFQDISFSVRKGEVVGFFGLVGAGRSEIMRAIFGVDKYQSGEVILDGKKLRGGDPAAAIRAGIGFCTEDRKKEGLALKLSILLNMTLVRLPLLSKLGVINRANQRAAADEYMESISIKAPSVRQLVGNLSGGNQQKVVVAKWLMMHPKVLIVDAGGGYHRLRNAQIDKARARPKRRPGRQCRGPGKSRGTAEQQELSHVALVAFQAKFRQPGHHQIPGHIGSVKAHLILSRLGNADVMHH